MDYIRTLSIEELKKEIRENLEYAHPQRDTNPLFNVGFGIQHGFQPVVNNIFFDNEKDAIDYTFSHERLYQDIRGLSDDVEIIESYDSKNDTLVYTVKKINNDTLTQTYDIWSPKNCATITYTFTFTKNAFWISVQNKKIICTCEEDLSFCWENNETIENLFSHEQLIYPENTKNLFEQLWSLWKENQLDNEKTKKELISVMNWINTITLAKPSSHLWNA